MTTVINVPPPPHVRLRVSLTTWTRARTVHNTSEFTSAFGGIADMAGLATGSTRSRMPSRPREFHPEPLTDPDLILSHHPARVTARRLPPSVERRALPGEPVGPNQRR